MEPSVSAQFQFTDRETGPEFHGGAKMEPRPTSPEPAAFLPAPQMAWLPLIIGNHLGSPPKGLLWGLDLEVGCCLPLGFLPNPRHSSDLTGL